MNRLVNYSQPGIQTSIYETPQFELQYNDTRKLLIKSTEIDSGQSLLSIPYTDVLGRIIPVSYNDALVDLDLEGMGGILDGISLAANTRYHIWSGADKGFNSQGFGVTAVPISGYSIGSAYAKATEATLTGITKAYRFTLGARVRVMQVYGVIPTFAASEWNLGTITSIDNASQIKVLLDNNSNYGINLATTGAGVSVEQLDNFKPYLPNNSSQSVYFPNYSLIGRIETDSSSDIYQSFKSTVNEHYPVASSGTFQGILMVDQTTTLNATQTVPLVGNTHLLKNIPENAVKCNFVIKVLSGSSPAAFLRFWNTGFTSAALVIYSFSASAYMDVEHSLLLRSDKNMTYQYHDRSNARTVMYLHSYETD